MYNDAISKNRKYKLLYEKNDYEEYLLVTRKRIHYERNFEN